MITRLVSVALASLALHAASTRADLTVSAAISLKGALEKARPELEKSLGEKITWNFGASGTLVGQIQQGAPVDLFISADRATAQKLVAAHAGENASLTVVAGNALVLVVPKANADLRISPRSFSDLPKVRKVAIGEPKAVPAGAYATEVLTRLKLWDELEKAGKLVTGENVAQVMALVQRGEVDAGVVYATDARSAADKVTVVMTADPSMHSPIEYVSVIVSASKHKASAAKLQQALLAPAAQETMREFGFTAPAAPPAATAAEK
ncbi:MAG TPA: molybdate ABC transporter substrate-binding protein [Phycisphaerae bacterium]|nr:molybdate ABC transporter substrate-binding protein [Phycisphaerae bacterium]